jgi:Holliday junction resolvase RusA-like endonuclease
VKIEFTISCIPRGQTRARHAVVAGHSRTYKSKEQQADERTLEAIMYEFKPPNPLAGAISVSIRAIMPIPKSKPKKWQIQAHAGLLFPTGKPDLDNVAKNILDVLVAMRFMDDDRQVCELHVSKTYDTEPGYHISLKEM